MTIDVHAPQARSVAALSFGRGGATSRNATVARNPAVRGLLPPASGSSREPPARTPTRGGHCRPVTGARPWIGDKARRSQCLNCGGRWPRPPTRRNSQCRTAPVLLAPEIFGCWSGTTRGGDRERSRDLGGRGRCLVVATRSVSTGSPLRGRHREPRTSGSGRRRSVGSATRGQPVSVGHQRATENCVVARDVSISHRSHRSPRRRGRRARRGRARVAPARWWPATHHTMLAGKPPPTWFATAT
jgi:hypothetical protein